MFSSTCLRGAVLVALVAMVLPAVADDGTGDATGEQLYVQQCASCHGKEGEGVRRKYSRRLRGEKTLPQLRLYIEEEMPEDEPESLVGADAERVARYVWDAFYSPIAQARNEPPRIAVSRLTVEQYRNAVADLIGAFRPATPRRQAEGMHAEYFDSVKPDRNRVHEEVLPRVRLDFDAQLPIDEKRGKNGFSARYSGSVIAPDSGRYEFIVRTDHAVRLWVNDRETALLDAWVKSGDGTEHRASIELLGGRSYPLRLEFTSRQQGVQDKVRKKAVGGFLQLAWRRPHLVDEVIPQRYLRPDVVPECYVVKTGFPPDDRSHGYERGVTASEEWVEAVSRASIEVSRYVLSRLPRHLRVDALEPRSREKVREFCVRFLERAFRRPLDAATREAYIDRHLDAGDDVEEAARRVLLLALNSPRFLYVESQPDLEDAHGTAARLAWTLLDSLPDDELRRAATAGELSTPEELRRQAERLVDDPRARSKLRRFLYRWLDIDEVRELSKDAELYPDFDRRVAADLRESLDLFLERAVFGEQADFRRLFDSREIWLNGRLAEYYGYDLPEDAPFQKLTAKSPDRVGLPAHPYLLSRLAYDSDTSPIHRGVFLIRSVFGRVLLPPPEALTPLAPDLHPGLTTRERVALQTRPDACRGCHRSINPLGFTLERFDATGRTREKDRGKAIVTSGSFVDPEGRLLALSGSRELGERLALNSEVQAAFVSGLFHYVVRQPLLAYGVERLPALQQRFEAATFKVKELFIETALVAVGASGESGAPSAEEAPSDRSPEPSRRRI